jgi:V/A-type H+-transporting ATPase subunit D
MALKYQYNKTELQRLNKQLQVRIRALPTLKNKESALRVEVKRARDKAAELEAAFSVRLKTLEKLSRLWNEFDADLVKIRSVEIITRKIAGVKIPTMGKIEFEEAEFSLYNRPKWYFEGMRLVKELASISVERQFFVRKMHILDAVRKKTTQKVNLYEKVQIPAYEEAIRKIKRFLEDEENLSKSGQKILKSRMAEAAA